MKRLVLSTALFLFALSALAAQEVVTGFKLQHCQAGRCSSLRTDRAFKSSFDRIYVFGSARLATSVSKSQGRPQPTVFTGTNGYYDPITQRIVLRQVSKTIKEMVLNLKTGTIYYF